MKINYFLLTMAVLLTACNGGNPKTEQQEFTLTGKFADNSNDGKFVYLQIKENDTDNYISTDTATITNGIFTFKGIVGEDPIGYISTEAISKPALFIKEEGSIEMIIDTARSVSIKGTALNDKYQEYTTKRVLYNNEIREISNLTKQAKKDNKLTPEYEAKLNAEYDSIYNETKQYTFSFAKENIGNVLGQYILMDKGRLFDEKELQEILPMISPKLKEDPRLKKIESRFAALQATSIGKTFVDLKGKTPEGKDISLSEYAGKGNYVLIDFWASWCPPCRKEMPTVVTLYDKYKAKGFEIVGVSLDKTNEDWVEGIKELKITWPQISDLKYWQSELSAAYAVNSIPHMVLLDKEGKIIARGITAHELSDKLAELLK